MNTLHIYGPGQWHSSVKIKGTLESLILLRDSLDKIIKKNEKLSQFESFTPDGEEFLCEIFCYSDKQIMNSPLPYYNLDSNGRLYE